MDTMENPINSVVPKTHYSGIHAVEVPSAMLSSFRSENPTTPAAFSDAHSETRSSSISGSRKLKKQFSNDYLFEGATSKVDEFDEIILPPLSRRIISHTFYTVIIFFATTVTAVGDDLVTLFAPKQVDIVYSYTVFVCLLIFLFDLAINIYAFRKSYMRSIFFPLDVVATLTLIPQILPIWGVGDPTALSSLAVSRIGRVAKAAARAGKLIKIVRLFKQCTRKQELDEEEDSETVVSHAGQRLHNLTVRNVIIGVLLMFFAPIVFDLIVNLGNYATGEDLSIEFLTSSGSLECSHLFVKHLQKTYGNMLIKLRATYNGDSILFIPFTRTELRESFIAKTTVPGGELWLDVSKIQRLTAATNIGQTVYLLLILVFGNYFFVKDSERMFIKPVETMMKTLKDLEANPLGADMQTMDDERNEPNFLVESWKKLLDSLADQTATAIANSEMLSSTFHMTADIADLMADMDLDGAEDRVKEMEDVLLPGGGDISMKTQFERIITNLRGFKNFLPDTIFAKADEDETQKNEFPTKSDGDGLAKSRQSLAEDPDHKHPEEKAKAVLNVGLRRRMVSFLYLRLHGFNIDFYKSKIKDPTSFLEKFLTEFTRICVDNVRKCRGAIAFVGPGTMFAVWNSMSNVASHQQQACIAALRIQAELKVHIKLLEGLFDELPTLGIAVHCEQQYVGNIGTEGYTAIQFVGPAQDLCMALVDACKTLSCTVLLTSSIKDAASVSLYFVHRAVDVLRIGSMYESRVYELLMELPPATDEWMYDLQNSSKQFGSFITQYDHGFAKFVQGDFTNAITFFNEFVRTVELEQDTLKKNRGGKGELKKMEEFIQSLTPDETTSRLVKICRAHLHCRRSLQIPYRRNALSWETIFGERGEDVLEAQSEPPRKESEPDGDTSGPRPRVVGKGLPDTPGIHDLPSEFPPFPLGVD